MAANLLLHQREAELLPHQYDFVHSKARYALNSGGVGSGKSYALIVKVLLLLSGYPGIFGLIGAETFPMLRNTILRDFLEVLENCPKDFVAEYNKATTTFQFRTKGQNSTLIFVPLNEPWKLKSLTLGFAAVEELTEIKYETFNMLRTRLRQLGMPCQFFAATNPGGLNHWAYQAFVEKPIKNSEIIYSSSKDNRFLPAEYLADLEQMRYTNPDYYRRMVEGIWGALEGIIYDLPLKQRVEKMPEQFDKVIAGLDFGYAHPTGLSVIGVIEEKYHIIDEIYAYELTSGDIIKLVKQMVKKYDILSIYCDGARPEIIEDLIRAKIPAEPGIKNVFEGIMYIKSLIGGKNLVVKNSCTYHLREFDSYIWDSKNIVKEIPLKVNDHLMDAVRYACYTEFRKRRAPHRMIRL